MLMSSSKAKNGYPTHIRHPTRGSGCVCVGGGGVWNSLISKKLAHYSLSLKFLNKNNPLFFEVLIDFRQFLYDSVEKVLFKADGFFHDRNAKANTTAQSEYTVYIIWSRT